VVNGPALSLGIFGHQGIDPHLANVVELLEAHAVGCVIEGQPGEFTDITNLGRCP
jgi:hypothetical protein